MSNPHGSFIWYELMSKDPDASKKFYDDVVGWNIGPKAAGDIDYRMISAPDGNIGGVLRLTDEMCEGTVKLSLKNYELGILAKLFLTFYRNGI